LNEAGVTVSIVNPARVRDFARGLRILTKSEGIDALVRARFGALTLPAVWIPPSVSVRTRQTLLIPWRKICNANSSEQP
jgi:transposase